MGVQSEFARIWGGDLDSIWIGPLTAALPTSLPADLEAGETESIDGFEEIGWLDTDQGITETLLGSLTELRGHQGAGIVRTRMETPGTQFQFTALEDKALTNGLRYDVASTTVEGNVRRTVRRPGQTVKARKAVIDLRDADDQTIMQRILIPRLEIIPNGDKVNINNAIAAFPFIGTVIGNYEVLETIVAPPVEEPAA